MFRVGILVASGLLRSAIAGEDLTSACPADGGCEVDSDDQALLGVRRTAVVTKPTKETAASDETAGQHWHSWTDRPKFKEDLARRKKLHTHDVAQFSQDVTVAGWDIEEKKKYYVVHTCPTLKTYNPKKDVYSVAIVISGRARQETLLLSYLNDMVKSGVLDEVHIHLVRGENLTRIEEIAKPNLRTKILRSESFTELWHYYDEWEAPTRALHNRTVLVKMDDDIIHLDTAKFGDYVKYIDDNQDMNLVFANIVNNGVAAYYQSQRGCFPKTSNGVLMAFEYPGSYDMHWGFGGTLWESGKKAREVHRAFLDNSACFSWVGEDGEQCVVYRPPEELRGDFQLQGRFSLNFFGVSMRNKDFVFDDAFYASKDDETFLTEKKVMKNCMFTSLTVSHATFYTQGEITDDAVDWYTMKRMNLTNVTKTDIDTIETDIINTALGLILPADFDMLNNA